MAKTKQAKLEEANKIEKTETAKAVSTQPSYEDLMNLVQQLAGEVQALKSSQPAMATIQPSSTEELLNMLANRKSDREVTIVHNMEMNGNLTTHIVLTTVTIDFRHVGEQRVLSWQQFEECVSKYHSFFEKEIILLGAEDKELAERYGVPCIDKKTKVLTHKDIEKLPKMSARQLEDFVESLSDTDKDVVFSYWLGKCYERADGFYDRYKMDALNRLSKNGYFNNILLVMNGESIIDDK